MLFDLKTIEKLKVVVNDLKPYEETWNSHTRWSPYRSELKILIEQWDESNISNKNNDDEEELLNRIIQSSSTECLIILYESGHDLSSICDDENNTPVHIAARYNDIECLKYLDSAGCGLLSENSNGDRPLIDAVKFASGECVQFLREKTSTHLSCRDIEELIVDTRELSLDFSDDSDFCSDVNIFEYVLECAQSNEMLLFECSRQIIDNNKAFNASDILERLKMLKKFGHQFNDDVLSKCYGQSIMLNVSTNSCCQEVWDFFDEEPTCNTSVLDRQVVNFNNHTWQQLIYTCRPVLSEEGVKTLVKRGLELPEPALFYTEPSEEVKKNIDLYRI